MKTSELLAKELEALQQGKCWIGYNALEILDGIDHEKAQFFAFHGGNSIWQIINHISHWREVVAEQLSTGAWEGEEITGMEAPENPTAEAWHNSLKRFQQSYETLRDAIQSVPEENLEKTIGKWLPRHLMFGIIEHDAFHLGQVILLKRLLESRENKR